MSASGKPEKLPLRRRLRDVIRRNWRDIMAASLLMASLLLLAGMLVPGILMLWSEALARLTSLAGIQHVSVMQMPLLIPGLPPLQVPIIEHPLGMMENRDWLTNLGGASLVFLLAGLLPASRRTLIRTLCVLHGLFVIMAGVAAADADAFARHSAALGVLTLCLIAALPVFLCLTHSIIEPVFSRRLLTWFAASSYLVLAHPVKLVGHLLATDLMGPLALPTLFLAFGPALDLLALIALHSWVASWRRSSP
ncbi:hypothetical protein ACFONG_13930 [Uliginosibacterium paludis]|uniref:Uncharacterized protein n=1 Tax=Uliginosibacterium paludis TaxID=1615952 RepID=A0ABV2CPH1_9RHOO